MSAFSPLEITADNLAELLQSLSSADNARRTAAEHILNEQWLRDQPAILLAGLAQYGVTGTDEVMRGFSILLLRRVAFKQQPANDDGRVAWDALNAPGRKHIQALLLQSLASETVPSVRHKTCDTIAEIARGIEYEEEPWPELLMAMFQSSKSSEAMHRESAFRIFAALPEFATDAKVDHEVLYSVFQAGLTDPSAEVRLCALEAISQFLLSASKANRKIFTPLLPAMLNILPPLVAEGCSDSLTSGLNYLISLAEQYPKLFAPMFHEIVQFSVGVLKNKELDDSAKQAALELLLTFCEGAPMLCRKEPDFTKNVIEQSLIFMTEVGQDDKDDARQWLASDDLDYDESDANHIVGEQALDRVARKLGGKYVIQPAFSYLPQLASSQNWKERHAALMAISSIAEGCEKIMQPETAKVLDLVLPLVNDVHPRVRWAAANAVGQLSTDFAPTIEQDHHQRILSALVPLLQDSEPRIQSHAAAALVNFCEESDDDLIEPYLDGILERLLGLLQSPKRYVQEQAVTTIATVADAAEEKFTKYYDAIMPLLINFLKQADGKEYRVLRGKAMECATLIALAVGKEKFAPQALEVVHLLAGIQANVIEDDDPQASYLLTAWDRLCTVLGRDFIPFLDGVIPPLLKAAKAKPDFAVLEDEEDKENYAVEDGWEFLPIQGQQVGIKTGTLEDKSAATEILTCYASNLKGAFEPYVNTVLHDVVIPGLRFYFHDGVRSAAASMIPHLIASVKEATNNDPNRVGEILQTALKHLLKQIKVEPSSDMCAEFSESFYESLEVIAMPCLTPEQMDEFSTAVASQLDDYKTRRQERITGHEAGELDMEEDEEVIEDMEADEDLLSQLNKTIHTVFKYHRSSFLSYFEKVVPFVKNCLENMPDLRQWGLCVMDDVLEFCGSDACKYQEFLLPALVAGMTSNEPDVRQAAAYGVGQAADHFGPTLVTLLGEAARLRLSQQHQQQ